MSDYYMAPFDQSGEQLPFTVAKCFVAGVAQYEAWDCRTRPAKLIAGRMETAKEAQEKVEKMK